MQRDTCIRRMAALAGLFLALGASAQEPSYRPEEIFVPQTSEFTQHHPLAGITSFDLSPDGKTLAVEFGTQEPDKTIGAWVAVWDVNQQRLIGAKQVDRDIPYIVWYRRKIGFSPDGRMLLVLTGPRLVALSFPELKILYAFEDRVLPENAQNQMFIEGFAIAANRLAILRQYDNNSDHSYSLEVKIVDLDSGRVLARWSKSGYSRSISLSPDGNLLALTINPVPWGERNIPAGENNGFIVKPDSGEIVRALNLGYAAGDAEFLPGGTELITVPIDHGEAQFYPQDAVKVWNVKTGQVERKLGYPKYGVRGAMSISANGEWAAVTNVWLNPMDLKFDRGPTRGYARLLVWNLASGRLVYDSGNLGREYNLGGAPIDLLMGAGPPAVLVRMSASGNRLALGGELISVYSVETARPGPGS